MAQNFIKHAETTWIERQTKEDIRSRMAASNLVQFRNRWEGFGVFASEKDWLVKRILNFQSFPETWIRTSYIKKKIDFIQLHFSLRYLYHPEDYSNMAPKISTQSWGMSEAAETGRLEEVLRGSKVQVGKNIRPAVTMCKEVCSICLVDNDGCLKRWWSSLIEIILYRIIIFGAFWGESLFTYTYSQHHSHVTIHGLREMDWNQ